MNKDATTKKTAKSALDEFDWAAFDAMTDEEVHAAAFAGPDAQPMTEARHGEPALPRLECDFVGADRSKLRCAVPTAFRHHARPAQ
jgi:hypothetical protein